MEPLSQPKFEIRVGLFTVIALIILLWGWSWLKAFSLHTPQRFIVKFHDIAGLNLNATVNVNGVRVGTVERIILHGKGQVLVGLKITNEDIVIPEGSTVTIQTLGLVGAKYVEITLPTVEPNQPPPPPIAPDTVLIGEDPIRSELYLNKIAANINNITGSLSTDKARESLTEAAENAGRAVDNFKDAAARLNSSMGKFEGTTKSFTTCADKFSTGATSAQTFFNEGTQTFKHISILSDDLKSTSHRVDKILDNPNFSSDLKETARLARETADKVYSAIHELDNTVSDKPLRQDLLTLLNRLADSTENIKTSVQSLQALSKDTELRSDVKEIVANAKSAVEKADRLLSEGSLVDDARLTMAKLRATADDVSQASNNINRIVGGKHPILHLFLAGGGKKKIEVKQETSPASPSSSSSGPPHGKTSYKQVSSDFRNAGVSNSQNAHIPTPGSASVPDSGNARVPACPNLEGTEINVTNTN